MDAGQLVRKICVRKFSFLEQFQMPPPAGLAGIVCCTEHGGGAVCCYLRLWTVTRGLPAVGERGPDSTSLRPVCALGMPWRQGPIGCFPPNPKYLAQRPECNKHSVHIPHINLSERTLQHNATERSPFVSFWRAFTNLVFIPFQVVALIADM